MPEEPTISDDEVEDFYEANNEQFEQPASRDVRVILNASEAKVEQAKAELEADDSDASWKKVATKFSDRPGLQGPRRPARGPHRGRASPQLDEEIFAAAEGELVGPFETDRGFYVFQVDRHHRGDHPAARRGRRTDRPAARLSRASRRSSATS